MTDTLRPLPILTPDGSLPSGASLVALRFAKEATGYPGRVLPAKAVQGSPGPILAIGIEPDWLTSYVYVDDYSSITKLSEALEMLLMDEDNPAVKGEVDLLSKWFQGEVKFLGTEEYDGPN